MTTQRDVLTYWSDTGPFQITASSKRFNVYAPRPKDFQLSDAFHALAMICRFGGHVKRFYSVAQHSLWVARFVPRHLALHGLLHDVSEAYIGDLVSGVKLGLRDYRNLEVELNAFLWRELGLEPLNHDDYVIMHDIDHRVCFTEAKYLFRKDVTHLWPKQLEPLNFQPRPDAPGFYEPILQQVYELLVSQKPFEVPDYV